MKIKCKKVKRQKKAKQGKKGKKRENKAKKGGKKRRREILALAVDTTFLSSKLDSGPCPPATTESIHRPK